MASDKTDLPVKKESNGHYDLSNDMQHEDALRHIRTAGSISISPELFEKLYLSPQNRVHGDLRQTFGNPTPLAVIGFLLSLFPLSMELLGFRGTGGPGLGAAQTGAYYFCGGLLSIIGSVGEWLLGNTFPFVVFGSFGAFWLTFAATLQPFYNATEAYADNPTDFYASYAFLFLAMAIMVFLYFIASLRTNVAFSIIFLSLILAFSVMAGTYWQIANGNVELAGKLQKVAGAFFLVTCAAGTWIFTAILLAAVDFPIELPVGDLSQFVRGASERRQVKINKV